MIVLVVTIALICIIKNLKRIVDCGGVYISYFNSTIIDSSMGGSEGLRISSKDINSISAE